MKILITGGNGRVGRALCALLAREHTLRIFDVTAGVGTWDTRTGNLLEFADVERAVEGLDAIVHLAAVTGRHEPLTTMDTNVRGTYHVYEAAVRHGINKIVLASSVAVYGCRNPDFVPDYLPLDEEHPCRPGDRDNYDSSKVVCEAISRSYCSVYPALSSVCLRFASIENLADFKYGQLDDRRNFLWTMLDLEDACGALRAALARGRPGHRAYNVGMAATTSRRPSLDLVRAYFPDVPLKRSPDYFQNNPNAPLYAIDKLNAELGFKPSRGLGAS